ncbi:acyl-CoA dehydrogenase family protein [Streptomyces sp. PT12]|uniref:acyl-CoA dehydrogenase family protein n=1 Tax=Streptomyces sp. PT12 TaxID=1510197 RepID=UPI000DE41C77|nr:acyl-CoA dehydrogenase family protein [Streptomyces sp. PT12]RBM20478.1 acyl-CoA dehydrogenase [Streptomyces sp. PT12]
MRDTIEECERAGHEDGLAAGLALALDGAGAAAAPGRLAALPRASVPRGARVVPHALAEREGVAFVRPGTGGALPSGRLTALGARLAAARLGTSRRLMDRVVAHLAARESGGEPLIRKQLVRGALADALVTVETTRRTLVVAAAVGAAVADAHDRLTSLDWELAKLLGASGYAGEGATHTAFVSRLTANCWVPREGSP